MVSASASNATSTSSFASAGTTAAAAAAAAANGSALLSAMCGSKRPFAATLHHHAMDGSVHAATADPTQKRSPLLCGYPSKKCWAWRVEKRNGELHKFCEYHRQKANTNQRRMEQRRKNGRSSQQQKDANSNSGADGDAITKSKSADIKQEPQSSAASSPKASIVKTEALAAAATVLTSTKPAPPSINTAMANAEKAAASAAASSSFAAKKHSSSAVPAASPRGVEHFDYISPPLFSWAEVDLDIGMDAAVEYMMIDHAIDSEPSDKPVDLYEEDLYFLEHFIAEIAATGV